MLVARFAHGSASRETLFEDGVYASLCKIVAKSLIAAQIEERASERATSPRDINRAPRYIIESIMAIEAAARPNEHRCHNYFQCFKSTVAAKSIRDPAAQDARAKDQSCRWYL